MQIVVRTEQGQSEFITCPNNESVGIELCKEIAKNGIDLEAVLDVHVDLNERKVTVLSSGKQVVLKDTSNFLFSCFISFLEEKRRITQFQQLFPQMESSQLKTFSRLNFEHYLQLYQSFGEREGDCFLIKRLSPFFREINADALSGRLEVLSEKDEAKRKKILNLVVFLIERFKRGNGVALMEIAFGLVDRHFSEKEIEELKELGFSPEQMAELSLEEAKRAIESKVPMPKYEGNESLLNGYMNAISVAKEDAGKCQAIVLASVISPRMEAAMLENELPIAHDWNCFVVHRKEIGELYESDQLQYGTLMHHLTHDLFDSLKEGDIDVDRLLFRAAMGRRAIGYFFGKYADSIGKPRAPNENAQTPCREGEIYENLGKRLTQLAEKVSSPDRNGQVWLTWGERGELTTFHADSKRIYHTSVPVAEKVMEHVKAELYPQILAETDEKRVVERAGEIFWWICQAKPWTLGDPSIAEVFVKSILLSKGIDLGMWKKEIIPWEEASVARDAVSFGKLFSFLFTSPQELRES